jgi:uncharacterized protein (TIGR03437 family)
VCVTLNVVRALALFLLALSPVHAQFSEFAVTDDGRLFFTTPLSTGTEDARSKIYRVTSDGIALFATGSGDQNSGTIAIQPLTSGDGGITGYGINYPCRTGSCGLFAQPRTFFSLQGIDFTARPYDNIQVSRNGRFLLGKTYDGRTRRIDLQTQEVIELPQFLVPISQSQAISNSGAMLVRYVGENSSSLQVGLSPAGLRIVPGSEGAIAAIISPDDRLVSYERRTETHYELWLNDPAGTANRLLASVPLDLAALFPGYRFVYHPSFANNGSFLYLAPDPATATVQPMLLAPSAEPRRLLTVDEGVQNCILSGNGELAWVVTYSGRLLRVRTFDGGVDEFIPETPFVNASGGGLFAFPGSVLRLTGSGLSERTQITLNDTALAISEFSGQNGAVQLPWEFRPSHQTLFFTVQGAANPFHQTVNFSTLDEPTISFERAGFPIPNILQAAHQDFHGLLSGADPALPGETIHVFARNLGPVDPPVPSGQPSPSDPPAHITTPLACYLSEPDTNNPRRTEGVVVPFAGLSGGSVGIYQIDVTIPSTWTASTGYLQCRMGYRGDTNSIPIGSGR